MSTGMASASLSDVRIDRPRRHTQGPVELAIAHRTPKVSTKSNPDLYQNQFKLTQQYDEKVHTKMGKRSDFVYVNTAYVGSVDNVNISRLEREPPTSVIREQYWACSRWPYTQRVLAIAVGVLLGAVIGMVVTFVMRNADQDILPGFLMGRPAPD